MTLSDGMGVESKPRPHSDKRRAARPCLAGGARLKGIPCQFGNNYNSVPKAYKADMLYTHGLIQRSIPIECCGGGFRPSASLRDECYVNPDEQVATLMTAREFGFLTKTVKCLKPCYAAGGLPLFPTDQPLMAPQGYEEVSRECGLLK